MLFRAFKGSWTVHHMLDSHPHGTARHLPGYLEGLDALTQHQGVFRFHKGARCPGVFPSYQTLVHTESPPFLYETFEKRPLFYRQCFSKVLLKCHANSQFICISANLSIKFPKKVL
jgi:hypothetical protein